MGLVPPCLTCLYILLSHSKLNCVFQTFFKNILFHMLKIQGALATINMFVLPHTIFSLCFQARFPTKQTTDTTVSNKHLKHHTIVVLYIFIFMCACTYSPMIDVCKVGLLLNVYIMTTVRCRHMIEEQQENYYRDMELF